MKKLVLLLAITAFANAGVVRLTAKLVKPVAKPVAHGTVKTAKLAKRIIW